MKKILLLSAFALTTLCMSAQNYLYFSPTGWWTNDNAVFNVCLKVADEESTILQLLPVEGSATMYYATLPATNYTQIRFLRLPSTEPLAGGDDWGWNKSGWMPFSYSEGNYWAMVNTCDNGANDKDNFTISDYSAGEDIVIRVKQTAENTWASVYLYAWEPATFGDWPGAQGVLDENGWFTFTLAPTAVIVAGHAIFNNGEGGEGGQFDANNVTATTTCYLISLTAATPTDCSTSDVKELIHNNVYIYPNPVKDFINISGIENGTNIEIFNVTGQLISTAILQNNSIDANQLKTGVYFLKYGNHFAKFVKE
jgi:hypothetical protein